MDHLDLQTTGIPRPEYPRPQFVRDGWMNLNGKWDFLFDFGNSGMDQHHSPASFGFYGGAGADMAVGKHRLSLTANYVYRNFGHYSMKAPMFTICLGWVF